MSILVNKNTRVVVQGITGKEGSFHATQCKAYGTKVVAGVTPGKAGQEVEGIPVFNTVADAVKKTEADTSLIGAPEAKRMSATCASGTCGPWPSPTSNRPMVMGSSRKSRAYRTCTG